MATQKVKVTKTTKKSRQKKTGGNSGYKKCSNCGGDGRVKIRT